jgi:phage FluMu protein Com
MKNVTKVQSMVETSLNPSITVKCPYCSVITTINRLMTEPKCKHFEDFTIFKKEPYSYCEMDEDDGNDEVRMVETTFRMNGSRYPNVTKKRTGELVETDEGFNLIIDGKFDSFVSMEQFMDILNGDDEDDEDNVQYIIGD